MDFRFNSYFKIYMSRYDNFSFPFKCLILACPKPYTAALMYVSFVCMPFIHSLRKLQCIYMNNLTICCEDRTPNFTYDVCMCVYLVQMTSTTNEFLKKGKLPMNSGSLRLMTCWAKISLLNHCRPPLLHKVSVC